MVTHSRILAWRIPWTEEPGGLQSQGHKELDTIEEPHSLTGQIYQYIVQEKIKSLQGSQEDRNSSQIANFSIREVRIN